MAESASPEDTPLPPSPSGLVRSTFSSNTSASSGDEGEAEEGEGSQDGYFGPTDLEQLQIIANANPRMMLDTKSMNGLLEDNTDQHASSFLLYTDHGTIIGHSSNIVPPKIKSLAALSSFTWRRHKESLELAQRTAPDIQRMKTLRLIHKKDKPDPDLKTMIVEWDGLTAAIEEVKARCLIAAIKDSTYFEGEGDPYGKQISALSLARKGRSTGSNDNATAVIGAASNVDKEEAATTSGSTITTSGEAINVGSSASSGGDDKYVKKAEGGGSGVDGDDDALKELKELGLTKIDALMLRAEALAEAVAEDWIGEVPQGFY